MTSFGSLDLKSAFKPVTHFGLKIELVTFVCFAYLIFFKQIVKLPFHIQK